jgi:hypothetical protein
MALPSTDRVHEAESGLTGELNEVGVGQVGDTEPCAGAPVKSRLQVPFATHILAELLADWWINRNMSGAVSYLVLNDGLSYSRGNMKKFGLLIRRSSVHIS